MCAKLINAPTIEMDRPLALLQPQQTHAQSGLARSRLTDNTHGFARVQRDIDLINRPHFTDLAAEETGLDREIAANILPAHYWRLLRQNPHIVICHQWLRFTGEKFFGITMLRIKEHLVHTPLLYHFALLHHRHAVGKMLHHVKVVGNEQHCHTELCLQLIEQLQDLLLDGNIERRCWFISDQQLRSACQRHGDHHALALPAGKLMRIGIKTFLGLGDSDSGKQGNDARSRLISIQSLMQHQRFDKLLTHTVDRIECGHRLLKNHRDITSANSAHCVFVLSQQLPAIKQDAAAAVLALRAVMQQQDRERRHRFARARLPHKRQFLSLHHGKAHAVHHGLTRTGTTKGHGQIVNFQ